MVENLLLQSSLSLIRYGAGGSFETDDDFGPCFDRDEMTFRFLFLLPFPFVVDVEAACVDSSSV